MHLPDELGPFSRTLQQTQAWIKDMQSILEEGTTPDRAYTALRAGLHAIRDRIAPGEAMHLAAHMPLPIRGMYFDGYHLHEPHKARRAEDFLDDVARELQRVEGIGPREAFDATLKVLAIHVPEGELEQVRQMFHKELQPFWEEALAN